MFMFYDVVHKWLRMSLVSSLVSHCSVHLMNISPLSSACRKRAVLNIRLTSVGWAFLPMVQLCRRRLWNGSHPLRWCTCVVGNWRVMLTWPCCLKMVAISDVTSKVSTSKCRYFFFIASNVSNRTRFSCLLSDVPLVLQKRCYQSKNFSCFKSEAPNDGWFVIRQKCLKKFSSCFRNLFG